MKDRKTMTAGTKYNIEKPYYPIVYVRGYAMRHAEREETFNDTYYGFSATSVEKREALPPDYSEADVFEGQLIRFMKIRDYGYADAVNRGLEVFHANPSRSIWVSRFYDRDYIMGSHRSIEEHADDLYKLVCQTIPTRLKASGVNLGQGDKDYKVILIAHSMGGLVCRTLIQNLLPHRYKEDPKRWIHRLVTLGTPHRGIELGNIPDFLEDVVSSQLNPFGSNIFNEERMRDYLKLQGKKGKKYRYDVHSLGPQDTHHDFPVKRCLCIIGSDHPSYSVTKGMTGNFSDGLVKQDRAYVVAGEAPVDNHRYSDDQVCYYANVHRAHSGYRGIVNSLESYENIQRFLFGNIKAEISLENIQIHTPEDGYSQYFYDFEFLISIRGTSVYLHRREQDPCENAVRLRRKDIPERLLLHTGFMNSKLKEDDAKFSRFALTLRVIEYRVEEGFLWDREYPGRPIYVETLEIRVGDSDPSQPGDEVGYRWRSEVSDWKQMQADNGVFRVPLRHVDTISAEITIKAGLWPDVGLTKD
jgi:hypothetical protein